MARRHSDQRLVLIALAAALGIACRPTRRLPDLPTRVLPPMDSVLAESLRVLRAAIEAPGQPVYLEGPTLLVLRPGSTFLDTAGTAATLEQVRQLERAWPRLQALGDSAGFVVVKRHAPGLVIDPSTARTYVPPVPAGRIGLLLLAPGARAQVFDTLLSDRALRAVLRRYRTSIASRQPRA